MAAILSACSLVASADNLILSLNNIFDRTMNAEFIKLGLLPSERLEKLNAIAVSQLKTLLKQFDVKKIDDFLKKG